MWRADEFEKEYNIKINKRYKKKVDLVLKISP